MEKLKKSRDNILWIFLHLPKTGGSTFSSHIIKEMGKEGILRTSLERYSGKQKKDKNKVKAILGHATYYGIHKEFPNKDPRYIIFLRDPAERLVSAYNFEMRTKEGKNLTFKKWYKKQIKNEMVHFLDLKYKGRKGTKINLPSLLTRSLSRFFDSKKFIFSFKNYLCITQKCYLLKEKAGKNLKILGN